MKFLARMMMVFALLGVLAYGSFAFGKYVLSVKLFGDDPKTSKLRQVSRTTTQASAVTRQTNWKGTKPRVDVKVLPADQTGGGPTLPVYADEDAFSDRSPTPKKKTSRSQSEPEPAPAARLGNRKFDDVPLQYSPEGERKSSEARKSSEERKSSSRRRRTRRKKPTSTADATQRDRDSAEVTAQSSPAGDNRNDSDAREDSTPRETPRETTRPRERSRERTRERNRRPRTSPVPRPEGSSGGDSADISPVPQPE